MVWPIHKPVYQVALYKQLIKHNTTTYNTVHFLNERDIIMTPRDLLPKNFLMASSKQEMSTVTVEILYI